MRGVTMIWGSLCLFVGVVALRGPGTVTIPYGATLSVRCDYDEGYQSYVKYWCKGASWKHCAIIISSRDDSSAHHQRYSIEDNRPSLSFTVIGREMTPGDSDTYYCGMERTFNDYMTPVMVTVLPGLCRKTPPWSSIVDFPPEFESIKENEVVKVWCKEAYEKKTFPLTCVVESAIFQLYPHPHPSLCTRKCERMAMIRGPNVSMYPVKEYYGRDEDVTLTCPEGSLPNYNKIQCIRDNSTNRWNVSQVFCVHSPKKCERMAMIQGPNISMYPVKEYYGQDEDVTLICPEGSLPNYNKIRCIRDNGTNRWNVSQVFCVHSPTVPPGLPTHPPSWMISCCFGLLPPMVVKLMTILVILAKKICNMIRRRRSSPDNRPDIKMMKPSNRTMSNFYKVEDDRKISTDSENEEELIYENMEVAS